MTAAPTYLKDTALDEWTRVCEKHYAGGDVPDDVAGPLAIYCGIHGALATAIEKNDIGLLVKLAPLVGQYRTLAAALFGRGSTRQQPGKNPFAQLKDRKARRVKTPYMGAPKSGHYCDAVKTSGYWKGLPCGAAGVHAWRGKRYCGSHLASVFAAERAAIRSRTTPRRSPARNRARVSKGRTRSK